MSILTAAQSLSPRLIEIRRELHRHPELSMEEYWTTARLTDWLQSAGLTILDLGLPVGVVAEVRGAHPGPLVALRSDIDALPVEEETGLEFASTVPGKMHACGHDFHMSVILGAALILQSMREQLHGTIRFLFQPAEEDTRGAKLLIKAGALEGVQAVFGLHNKPDVAAGHVGIKSGPLMAATDMLSITVSGKGGHAAIPDATIDPVVAGSAIVMALQTAVSRSISPLDSAVVTVASFQAGAASNVIPPEAKLLGTLRTFTPALRQRMRELVGRIAREVAAGYGATAEVAWTEGPPAVTNDPAMAELTRQAAGKLGLPVVEAIPTMGGEDFAEYQQLAPGCFVWLGTGTPDPHDVTKCIPRENWHHPKFTVDEDVIHKGAALFAQVTLEALEALKN